MTPRSLSAAAALWEFRDATGILDVAEETQCCRPPLVGRRNKVLAALVKTGSVRK